MSITSKDLRALADALDREQTERTQADALYGLVRELYNSFGENEAYEPLWNSTAWIRAREAVYSMPAKYDVDNLPRYIPEEYKHLDWFAEEDYGDGKSTFCFLYMDEKCTGVVRSIGMDLFVASGYDEQWATQYGPPRDTVQESMKDLVEHVEHVEHVRGAKL